MPLVKEVELKRLQDRDVQANIYYLEAQVWKRATLVLIDGSMTEKQRIRVLVQSAHYIEDVTDERIQPYLQKIDQIYFRVRDRMVPPTEETDE